MAAQATAAKAVWMGDVEATSEAQAIKIGLEKFGQRICAVGL
jgi:hypothetical protein